MINGGPPNGETLYGMYTRIASFLDELKKEKYKKVLIITHAGVLRCVKAYMETLSKAYDTAEKSEFYSYIRGLDALKKSLVGDDKTLILDKNSELARILYGNFN